MLKTASIAERGKWYELAAQAALLKRLKRSGLHELVRVGRAGDRGVDLAGRWNTVDLAVQCKSSPAKAAPLLWRELGGVHAQQARHSTLPSLVALVSPLPMTKAAHAEFAGSELPFMHFVLPLAGEHEMSPEPPLLVPPLAAIHANAAAKSLLRAHSIAIPRIRSSM